MTIKLDQHLLQSQQSHMTNLLQHIYLRHLYSAHSGSANASCCTAHLKTQAFTYRLRGPWGKLLLSLPKLCCAELGVSLQEVTRSECIGNIDSVHIVHSYNNPLHTRKDLKKKKSVLYTEWCIRSLALHLNSITLHYIWNHAIISIFYSPEIFCLTSTCLFTWMNS